MIINTLFSVQESFNKLISKVCLANSWQFFPSISLKLLDIIKRKLFSLLVFPWRCCNVTFSDIVYHPCQKSNGGCSHLCFIASSRSGQVHICDCPDHMQLYSDKKTCIPKNIPEINCNSGFVCKITNSCISQERVCDGMKNCLFNDDEQNCVSKSNTIGKSKSTFYITIAICISILLVILVVTVLICRHYRKRRDHLVEMR